MSDEMLARGDAWNVSASWPETCVLLSSADVPSISIDVNARILGVFDQIEAEPDWRSGTLRIHNPTQYRVKVCILKSGGTSATINLAPFGAQIVTM